MKKRLFIGSIVFCVILLLGWSVFSFVLNKEVKKEEEREREKEKRIATIQSHYAPFVQVQKKCGVYQKDGDQYRKIGKVEAGEILSLEERKDSSSSYFSIQNRDLYIPYSCVKKTEREKEKNMRYKNYVPFPEKVKTKSGASFYQDHRKVYELFDSVEFPVIKKDNDSYYVEYWDELFQIKKEDISLVSEGEVLPFAKEVPVTAYHFIYPDGDYSCGGIICHSTSQIRSHFEYLKENHFFTITTSEMEEFLDQKIQLPEKSILITIDDGDRAENIIPLLEEFQVNATLFLITAWYFPENYSSSYLELASHTHELHEPGKCAGGQGSALKCLEKSKIVEDLKLSRSVLNGTRAFCYPLYEYNDHAVDAVLQAGFSLGFIGGQRKASIHSPKLLIPRITLFHDTTIEEYIKIVS